MIDIMERGRMQSEVQGREVRISVQISVRRVRGSSGVRFT